MKHLNCSRGKSSLLRTFGVLAVLCSLAAPTGAATLSTNPVDNTTQAFGNQNVGTTSAAKSITVSNPSGATTTGITTAIAGANPTQFSSSKTCLATLVARKTCTVSVTFKPTVGGALSATLTISSANGGSKTFPLTGTGIVLPTLGVTPTSRAFGNQPIATTSAPQYFVVSNTGLGVATGLTVALNATGTTAGFAIVPGTCVSPGGTVAASGGSCNFAVTFRPTTTGSKTGTVSITASGITKTVSLTGSGVAATRGVKLTPTALTVACSSPGNGPGTGNVIVSNTGNSPATISAINITQTLPAKFSKSTTCPVGAALALGTTCNIAVTYTATGRATKTALLTAVSNATASTSTISSTSSTASGSATTLTGTCVGHPSP